jgi:phage shock protein A
MGYRLEMSAEIYDWLAVLRDSDPPAAVLAARALAALADGGDRLGPPLVTAVAAVRPRPDELSAALDQHYQDQLESLTLMRRRVAQAATLRKDIERQLTEPEPQDPAGLQERFAEAMAAEERLIAESQREQSQLDAFRTRKEVLKATYTAAEAEHLIEQAQGVGDDAVLPDDAAGAAARLDEIIG